MVGSVVVFFDVNVAMPWPICMLTGNAGNCAKTVTGVQEHLVVSGTQQCFNLKESNDVGKVRTDQLNDAL